MAFEEKAGQLESVRYIRLRRMTSLTSFEKSGQNQEPITIGKAGRAADCPARLRRHIDKILACASRRTAGEIETESQFIEKPELPANQQGGPGFGILERIENDTHGLIEPRMGLALRQELRFRGQCRQGGELHRFADQKAR